MNHNLVWHILGNLLIVSSATMVVPLGVSIYYKENDFLLWITTILITFTVGGLIRVFTKKEGELGHKDGFAVVSLGWLLLPLFGCIPFLLADTFSNPIDAYFECMSGYTTTGATVIDDIEVQPLSILFWRSLIQWLGGMGIIVLSIAILPLLGVGGMQLFKAEVPGPVKDRLTPRVTSTAKILWIFYVALSLAEFITLMIFGMSPFDSICHTFTTMATGGFSTKNLSAGAYNNAYIEMTLTFFMITAGINFSLYYKMSQRKIRDVFKDEEFRFYIILIAVSTLLIAFVIYPKDAPSMGIAIRLSIFQTVSMLTTTGYCTANFDLWPSFARFALISLMIVGGCAGSTGGGVKHIRILILFKHGIRELRRMLYPGRVLPVKVNGKIVSNEVVTNVMGFFLIYIMIFFIATLIICYCGVDLVTSFSGVIACLSNIGPGLAKVGAVETYSHLPGIVKIVLSFCMVVGRLELYTVLLLFIPGLWRK